MRDLGSAVLSGLACLGRPALWLSLLRLLLSARAIGFVVANIFLLVLVVAFALLLPELSVLVACAVWIYWAAPILAHAVSPTVARHTIGPAFPNAVEQAAPETAVYRGWLARPLAYWFVAILALKFIPGLAALSENSALFSGILGIILAALATKFYVRSAVCTYIPQSSIEASLRD